MATNYQAGASIERRVKEKLEAKGYYVIRSAGSHGVADLVVITPTLVELIQIKAYKGRMPNYKKLKEYKEFQELQVPKNVKKFIMLYKRNKGIERIVEIT